MRFSQDFPRRKKNNYARPELRTTKEIKNYYPIEKFQSLGDDSDSSFLLCVDSQTLELLFSLIEPKFYARWTRYSEALSREIRIQSEDDKLFIDRLWDRLQSQLGEFMCVSQLVEQQKLTNALMKRIVSAVSDRQLYHDSWYLENDPQFAYDPITNPNPLPTTTHSALISEGLIDDWNVADVISNVLSQGFVEIPDGTTTIQDDIQGLGVKVDTLNSWLDTLQSRFVVDGWVFDTNIAKVLNDTLRIGRTPVEFLSEYASISDIIRYYFSKEDTSTFAPKYQSIFSGFSVSIPSLSGIQSAIDSLLAPLLGIGTALTQGNTYHATTNTHLSTISNNLATIDSTLSSDNQLLIDALNNLDFCCSNETDKVVEALGLVALSVQDMSVTAIANAGNNVLINTHGSNGELIGGDIDNSCGSTNVPTGGSVIGNYDSIEDSIVNVNDCDWVDGLIDAVVTVLDYVEYGLVTFGVDKLIVLSANYLWPVLKGYSYFSRALAFVNATLLAGLDPSDVLTIGNLILEELIVAFTLNYSDTLISDIKQDIIDNRDDIRLTICDGFSQINPTNIDPLAIAESVMDKLTNTANTFKAPLEKLFKYALTGRKNILIKGL